MKNKLFIIALLSFLLVACSSNKLMSYLKSEGYKCESNICTFLDEQNEIQSINYSFDLVNNTYTEEKTFNGYGRQGYKIEYNWNTNIAKSTYYTPTSEFEIFYKLSDDNSYECTSNDEDKVYVKAECVVIQSEIKEKAKDVKKLIKEYE